MKIDFDSKGHLYTEEDISAIGDFLRTATTFTQGEKQKQFEKDFADWLGVKNCFAVANATCALELSAQLCRFDFDDEVIIPAHTFCATAIPFLRTKATIVWADIDSKTKVVSKNTIERCLSKNTKAVVAVHLYGLMCPMPEIKQMCDDKDLFLIEDCAQAPGAMIDGRKAGTFGDFACFSFHTHKNMSTLGEGGMLVDNNGKYTKMISGLRHNGIRPFENKDPMKFWFPAMSDVDFESTEFYENYIIPYNFCLTEVQCLVGSLMLKRIDATNQLRNKRAKKVIVALKDYPELTFQEYPDNYFHCYHLLSAKYKSEKATRDDFLSLMNFKHEIKTIVQYHPLYRYPMFEKVDVTLGMDCCPNTDEFFDNMISVPFHSWLLEEEIDYIILSLKNTCEELRNR